MTVRVYSRVSVLNSGQTQGIGNGAESDSSTKLVNILKLKINKWDVFSGRPLLLNLLIWQEFWELEWPPYDRWLFESLTPVTLDFVRPLLITEPTVSTVELAYAECARTTRKPSWVFLKLPLGPLKGLIVTLIQYWLFVLPVQLKAPVLGAAFIPSLQQNMSLLFVTREHRHVNRSCESLPKSSHPRAVSISLDLSQIA